MPIRLEAADTNQRINRARLHREQTQAEIDDARTQVSDINKQIAILKQKAETASQWADEEEQKLAGLPDLPELVDVQALQDQLSAAEEINQIFQLVEKAAQLKTKVTGLETEHGEADTKIQALRTQMAGAVAAAKLPVDGLDFNDTGVNLNGLPFEQASQAEQLKTAIAIAVALDPELRVLRVRDGALLGTAAMDQLAAFSDQFDMQIWIETVESDRPAAILIEDGTIAAHAVEAAE